MKDQVLERMDALGCEPLLRALVERLPDDLPMTVKAGRADWLPVAASHAFDAALYVNVRHMHVKLSPADARATAAATGCQLDEVNGQTGYVRVRSRDLLSQPTAELLDGAVRRALQRHIETGEHGERTGAAARVCPRTKLALPATGWCDDCERVCA